MTEQELIDLNLKVAAIAGWTDIKIWNPSALKKSYTGVNLAHPELEVHIPNYVESIDAIAKVFRQKKIQYRLSCDPTDDDLGCHVDSTEAIALCKLLLAINPEPIKPESEVAVIDDDGEIDEPTVIEATFG